MGHELLTDPQVNFPLLVRENAGHFLVVLKARLTSGAFPRHRSRTNLLDVLVPGRCILLQLSSN